MSDRDVYPAVWKKVIADWKGTVAGDYCWLIYSANYLLSTGGVRWALDPLAMSARVPGMAPPNFKEDLDRLQLIVLSHEHKDHFDRDLVAALQDRPIKWVIPEFMRDTVSEVAHISAERMISSEPGCPIHFGDLMLTPFEGLHLRDGNGVPELGYLAEFSGKRWLFPGDTRLFDVNRLPNFGPLNGVFAHLWLGKASALVNPPPLIDEFCEFFGRFSTSRLVITHLNEIGRDETERWNETHYREVNRIFRTKSPGIEIELGLTGNKVEL